MSRVIVQRHGHVCPSKHLLTTPYSLCHADGSICPRAHRPYPSAAAVPRLRYAGLSILYKSPCLLPRYHRRRTDQTNKTVSSLRLHTLPGLEAELQMIYTIEQKETNLGCRKADYRARPSAAGVPATDHRHRLAA